MGGMGGIPGMGMGMGGLGGGGTGQEGEPDCRIM